MGKRANPMAIRAALTYEISEAAQVLGKNPATIRNWIKDGLPVMSSRKPYLLSGEAIREFLRAKYKSAKSPLSANQLNCLSCRRGRVPKNSTVTYSRLTAKTGLLKGMCGHCGGTSTRMIALDSITDLKKTFRFT